MIHNHPQGSLIPSGLADDNMGRKAGTWGDIGNANYYNKYYANVKYFIYTTPGTYTPYYATEP